MNTVKVTKEVRSQYGDNGVLECWAWCQELFGNPGSLQYGARWEWDLNYTFKFKNELDAFVFQLRWG